MPSVDINSSNIITFEFSAAIDLYNRNILFTDLSTYGGSNGANKDNVQGISFKIEDTSGITYKDFDFTSPDIVPADGSTYTFDWSAFGLAFMLGNTLIITGGIKDQDGSIYYTEPAYKKICKPNLINESGYVPGTFQITPNCIDNVLTVKELTVLIYDKLTPSSVTKSGNLYYPTGTGITVAFTGTPFSNNLIITGQSRIENTTVATYDLGDEIYVLVTYITKNQYNINCSNFLGDIACCLAENQAVYIRNCDNAIGEAAKQKSYEVLPALMLGLLKQISGEDASKEVAFIKKTMACDCGLTSLGQNEMTPLNPAVTNIVLVGAGGTSVSDPVVNGDTKTFTILSKNYLVSKSDSLDLSYSITTDTSVENQVNFKLKFNSAVEAQYILNAISSDNTLLAQLNSLITQSNFNIDLSGLDGKCIIDLSSVSYFLSYKVPSGAALIKSILINGTTYTAPGGLVVSNTTGIEAWLNGLSLGTFSASFNNATTGAYINILTNANSNTVTSAVFTVNAVDNTVLFQQTSKSIVAVLQAMIDYICAMTALQVALGNTLALQYFDYNGDITSVTYSPTATQNDYNIGLQNVINNIVQRVNTLTGVTCDALKAIFIDRPLSSFGASDRFYGTLGGDCSGMTDQQAALAIIAAVGKYSNVKTAWCAVDCTTPSTCPEVANTSFSTVGYDIAFYGLTWATAPVATQTVTLKYKLSSSSVWIVASNAIGVLANGNLSGSTPYTISGLTHGSTYDVWVINNCGGVGFTKQVTIPTSAVYSGSYLLDVSIYNVCGDSPTTLYSSSPFAPGITMYSDVGLTTPVTGYNYIADSTGEIYAIDSSTGVVGADTSSNCSTGTSGTYYLYNSTVGICDQAPSTLYTLGAFAVGGYLYTDVSLTTPITGYSYVVDAATNKIYNLNSSTGQIGSDTGLTCSVYSGTFRLGNTELAVCAASTGTLYSGTPFGYGSQMFTDSGLTIQATGYLYISDVSGVIYNMDDATAIVEAPTGNAC